MTCLTASIMVSWLTAQAALSLSIMPSSQTVNEGEQVTAYVTITPVTGLQTIQFSLHWDPSLLSYSSSSFTPPGGGGNVGIAGVAQGDFGVSWYNAAGATIGAESTVLSLVFNTAGIGGSTALSFTDTPPGREIIVGNVDITSSVNWNNGSITVTAVPEPAHIALGVFGMVLAGARGVRWGLRRRQPTRS